MSSGDDAILSQESDFDNDDEKPVQRKKDAPKTLRKVQPEPPSKKQKPSKMEFKNFEKPVSVKRARLDKSSSEDSNEEDEEDDSDQSDDSDDFGDRRRRKLRDRQSRRKKDHIDVEDFIEKSAEESDKDSQNDQDDPKKIEEIRKVYQRREKGDLLERLGVMNDEEILKRYEDLDNEEKSDSDNQDGQAFLPSEKDPKIFAVKCKGGLEKEACVSLLRKAHELKGTSHEIMIFSASAIEKIPCHVFIEAYQEMHVRIACDGLLALNKEYIKVIPSKEVRDVYLPDPNRNITLKPNTFVRVKTGLYNNDLGLVDEVDVGKNSAVIKLVPRISFNPEVNEKHFQESRPAKKLLLKEENPELKFELHDAKNVNKIVYTFNKEKFENGFVKKRFAIKNLATENIHPMIEEVFIFKKSEPDENKWNEIIKKMSIMNEASKSLNQNIQKGDSVRVVSGDMYGMTGKAVEVVHDSIKVDFEGQSGIHLIEFKMNELEKVFMIGEQIEVIGGQYFGRTGCIINTNDKQATFISEDTHEELPVFLADIRRKTTKMLFLNNEANKQSAFQKYDLVTLNNNNMDALVLSVLPDALILIDTENYVTTQPKNKVEKKTKKSTVAKNSRGETVQEKCTVKVINGFNKNTCALVLKIFMSKAFLLDKQRSHNFGVFVEDVDNCTVLEVHQYDNSRKYAIHNNQARIRLQQEESSKNPTMNVRGPNTRNNPNSVLTSLIGQTKKLIKGNYKGYEGIIKSIADNEVYFELSAMNRIVKVPLDHLNVNSDERDTIANLANTTRTPLYKMPNSGYLNSYKNGTPAYRPNYH